MRVQRGGRKGERLALSRSLALYKGPIRLSLSDKSQGSARLTPNTPYTQQTP